jgi:hypothetical protein
VGLSDIRLAGSVEQALKMLNDKIESVLRRTPQTAYARYERTSAGTTAIGDNQLSFSVAVTPHSSVTPSGSGNNTFKLAQGLWIASVGARLLDGSALDRTCQLSVASSYSSSWAAASAKTVQNLPLNSAQTSLFVVSDNDIMVNANLYCAVAARTFDVASAVAHANFIEFLQVG